MDVKAMEQPFKKKGYTHTTPHHTKKGAQKVNKEMTWSSPH